MSDGLALKETPGISPQFPIIEIIRKMSAFGSLVGNSPALIIFPIPIAEIWRVLIKI
jgi:hypothetical protein